MRFPQIFLGFALVALVSSSGGVRRRRNENSFEILGISNAALSRIQRQDLIKKYQSSHQLSGSRYSLSHNIGSKQINQTYEHQSFRRGRRLGRVKINGEVREVKIFPHTKIFWRKSFKKINFSGKMRPPG